jgi:hypothetical protein
VGDDPVAEDRGGEVLNRCPRCAGETTPEAAFCPWCGVHLAGEPAGNPVCPTCGRTFPEGTRFCEVDGSRLAVGDEPPPRCVVCGTVYMDGTKYCPKDGGQVLPKTYRYRPGDPFDTGRRADPREFERIAAKEYAVRSGDWLRRGWELFKENPGWFIGFNAMAFIAIGILSGIPFAGAAIILASGPLWAGQYVVAFKRLRGQRTEFADFFRGFNTFLPVLLAGILTAIFVAVGTVLLIIPGVYLAVAYVFNFPLIVDRKIDFWQAMELSRRVVTRHWFSIFGFLLLLLLINVAGALLFGVGLLVSVPVTFCAVAAAYDAVFGIESAVF